MTISTESVETGLTGRLRRRLDERVRQELAELGLDHPDRLAESACIAVMSAAGILDGKTLSVETSLWLVDQLSLPIEVDVR